MTCQQTKPLVTRA